MCSCLLFSMKNIWYLLTYMSRGLFGHSHSIPLDRLHFHDMKSTWTFPFNWQLDTNDLRIHFWCQPLHHPDFLATSSWPKCHGIAPSGRLGGVPVFRSCAFFHLSSYLPIYLSVYVYLTICLSMYLSSYIPIKHVVSLSMYLSIYRRVYLCIYLSIHLSTSLPIIYLVF
jgi:hypothetical protein